MSGLHEECGVFGIYSPKRRDIATDVYFGLFALQHRGQESAGITLNDDGFFTTVKDMGLLNNVFDIDTLKNMGEGKIAMGHVRYGTTETNSMLNTQPLVINHAKGKLALAHNGNLTNSADLRRRMELNGAIFHTTSDAEILANAIIKQRLITHCVEDAAANAMKDLRGAYSMVLMSSTKLLAVRDPHGFRPLCIGTTEDGGYVFSSESCALDAIGAKFLRDVEPGEVVVASDKGLVSHRITDFGVPSSLCVFEYIYFARPDSVIDGASVHQVRVKAGEFLAQEHPVDADVVIGVPDSGLDAAIGYARKSGIPYCTGFIKSRYIARTFIQPTQGERETKVRLKLNPISSTVAGKRVVMIDDSIVRGTTVAQIVKQLREAGATEVHMRSSAPAFINPCYYGTDIDSHENLIAYNHSVEEITKIIGVDSMGFLSVENCKNIAEDCKLNFCLGCFNGEYPTDISHYSKEYMYEKKISEGKKN